MKKIISVITALFLILALAACASEPPAPEQPEDISNYEETQEPAAQVDDTVEEEPIEIIAEDIFRGIASTAMDNLFESLAEVSFDETSYTMEMMFALRANAAPGAIVRVADDFGLDDSFMIQMLDLVAASSIEFRSSFDLHEEFTMSADLIWQVRNLTEGGLSEILRIETLFVDNSIYLGIPQLIGTIFGADLSMFEFEQLDLLNEMIAGDYPEQASVVGAIDFLLERESAVRALVSDVSDAFFDSLVDNMSVEYDVSKHIGGENMYLNKAIITASGYELAAAAIEALNAISENDEHLAFFQELNSFADPNLPLSTEELQRLIGESISRLERYAEESYDDYFDIYLYIDGTDVVVGVGILSQDEAMVEAVFVEDVGFKFVVFGDDLILRLYGTHSVVGNMSRGEVRIFFSDDGLTAIEGKVLSFEYSDDSFSLTVSGRDVLNLMGETLSPEDITSLIFELLYYSEITIALEGNNESMSFAITVRHLDPEISLTFEFAYALGGDISIIRPDSEDVFYLDVWDLILGDENEIETIILSAINPFELFANLAGIFENLNQQGFDLTDLLADLMFGMF